MANKPTQGSNTFSDALSEDEKNALVDIERQFEAERGEKKPESLLVRGALLQCSCGTHCRRLNLHKSYGVYTDPENIHPKMHERNCVVGDDANISYYGVCQSKTPPKNADDVTLEPYVWPDGTKTSDKKIDGKRCMPEIMGNWLDVVSDEVIADLDDMQLYSGITTGSFLVCRNGGIITVLESGQGYVDE